MDLGLKGERALVVGGSYGIGYETARLLLEEGADVAVVSRDKDNLKKACQTLKQLTGRDPMSHVADSTRPTDVDALHAWIAEDDTPLDVLVHAVGSSRRASFEELSDVDWLENYELNVLSVVRVVRSMLPFLRRAEMGRIVILGAAAARMPYPHQVVSNVHKAGLFGLVKTLAEELAADNIRINIVSPGRTRTPLWINRANRMAKERGTDPETIIQEFSGEIPLKRFGEPEEIAAMVVFMASHRASYVTGQTVNVDGGIAKGLL